jgi:lysozyme
MIISQVGINLIKSFEGCVLHAYKATQDEKYYTIGYGHYGEDVRASMTITNKQAEELLKKDIQRFVDGVNDLLKVKVNQYQFDSLVSFAYNCGVGALRTSDLLTYTNQKQFEKAANEFGRWIHSNGKVLKGLVTRREAEKAIISERSRS